MASQWHYRPDGGEESGPISSKQLQQMIRTGELSLDTLVWREGLAEWVPARRIKGLADAAMAQSTTASPALARSLVGAVTPPLQPKSQAQLTPTEDIDLSPGPNGYRRIGITFGIAGKKFYGDVIASDAAIYLICAQRRNDVAAGVAGGLGGVVGGLIAGAVIAMVGTRVDGPRYVAAGSLPPAVRAHPTWPTKKLKDETPVFVVPRTSLSSKGITHPSWSNLLKMKVDDQVVVVEYSLFGGGKIRSFLEQAGWPLAWGSAAVARLGEDGDRGGWSKKTLATAATVAVLAVGVAIFLAVRGKGTSGSTGSSNSSTETTPASSLYEVAASGRINEVRTFLDSGADAHGFDAAAQTTAVHAAAAGNHVDVLQLLISRGAKATVRDPSGRAPLHAAAASGAAAAVDLLLSHDSDTNIFDQANRSPISLAMAGGHEPVVRKLVVAGAIFSQLDPQSGRTPLHAAAANGWTECVRLMMTKTDRLGANLSDSNRVTPLHEAVRSGRPESVEIARLLVAGGADPHWRNSKGETPLAMAKDLADQHPPPAWAAELVTILDTRPATPRSTTSPPGTTRPARTAPRQLSGADLEARRKEILDAAKARAATRPAPVRPGRPTTTPTQQ